ncbi:DUF448 domain-containing protein [Campylobacter estrildidarum]|uniref:DUF448 domain-containing protein n=1 Tax=Campylobacter estrildidarum TaxID=2510189 RepID=A0A4U7BHX8_9BACT|nr:DUF448 domain-containing protein [Campylobacter estrildidarum]
MLKNEKKRYNFKHKPVRMCVICKSRLFQKELHRLRIFQKELHLNLNRGRSIYVCDQCLLIEDKNFQAIFLKVCKKLNIKTTQQNIKEIILNGKN